MARIARVVVPGIPHHIVQRGNRRQMTFFEKNDYLTYIELMSELNAKMKCVVENYYNLKIRN